MKLRGRVIKFSAFLWGYVLVIRRIFFTTDMTDFKEQRICIKFCFNLIKAAAEIHWMLQEAFSDNAMSQSKTFLWYKHFKDGRTSVDDDECSGRLSTSATLENIAKVWEALLANCRQTIYDVCELVGLSYRTTQCILADNMNETHFCKICAKTAEQWPKGPLRFCLQGTQTTKQRRPQLHLQYHNRWWNMGVWLWPWD